jgi:hypothetical protein
MSALRDMVPGPEGVGPASLRAVHRSVRVPCGCSKYIGTLRRRSPPGATTLHWRTVCSYEPGRGAQFHTEAQEQLAALLPCLELPCCPVWNCPASEPAGTLPCCPGRRRKEDLHGLDVHMIDTMERYIRRANAGDVLVIISGAAVREEARTGSEYGRWEHVLVCNMKGSLLWTGPHSKYEALWNLHMVAREYVSHLLPWRQPPGASSGSMCAWLRHGNWSSMHVVRRTYLSLSTMSP